MSSRPKNTIYIGGLPTQCDESTLYTHFEPFGEIMQVQIPKVNHQQAAAAAHRGFGFVMFANDDEAESAIDNMHLNEVEGQIITVNLAKPLKNNMGTTGDSRKPIWESEEWIKEYGGGEGAIDNDPPADSTA